MCQIDILQLCHRRKNQDRTKHSVMNTDPVLKMGAKWGEILKQGTWAFSSLKLVHFEGLLS